MLSSDILNSANKYAEVSELRWVRNHTRTLKDGAVVVMLGAGPGVLGMAAVEGNPSIDLYVVDNVTTHWTMTHLESIGYHNGKYITADSSSTGNYWGILPVDFLIVDADHSFESVVRDIAGWWDHVKIGGHIFFHDYLEREGGFNGMSDWGVAGVAKAINYRKSRTWKYVANVGISIIYRKVV
jgi:methyltransferase family protein